MLSPLFPDERVLDSLACGFSRERFRAGASELRDFRASGFTRLQGSGLIGILQERGGRTSASADSKVKPKTIQNPSLA